MRLVTILMLCLLLFAAVLLVSVGEPKPQWISYTCNFCGDRWRESVRADTVEGESCGHKEKRESNNQEMRTSFTLRIWRQVYGTGEEE